MICYLLIFISVTAAGAVGEPVVQNWFGLALQARAGRVCYQRCTRDWQRPSQRCRAHCRGRPKTTPLYPKNAALGD